MKVEAPWKKLNFTPRIREIHKNLPDTPGNVQRTYENVLARLKPSEGTIHQHIKKQHHYPGNQKNKIQKFLAFRQNGNTVEKERYAQYSVDRKIHTASISSITGVL